MMLTEHEYAQMMREQDKQTRVDFRTFSDGMECAKVEGLQLEVFCLFVDQIRRNPTMTVSEAVHHALYD
jgi:hypothetical protein